MGTPGPAVGHSVNILYALWYARHIICTLIFCCAGAAMDGRVECCVDLNMETDVWGQVNSSGGRRQRLCARAKCNAIPIQPENGRRQHSRNHTRARSHKTKREEQIIGRESTYPLQISLIDIHSDSRGKYLQLPRSQLPGIQSLPTHSPACPRPVLSLLQDKRRTTAD